jgi:organic radical activating enzyme
MPQPPILKISEIFFSIQGEGLRQGEPTIFIRLSGCNLRCAFCDTKHAWREGRPLSIPHILEKVDQLRHRYPVYWACLTGGEPLLQDVKGLVQALKKKRLMIQVETNATLFRPVGADWYSISPKPPEYFYQPEYKEAAKEVKLITTRSLEFETIRRLRHEFPLKTAILLQPQSCMRWSIKKSLSLLRKTLEANLENIRLAGQLHKFYHLR